MLVKATLSVVTYSRRIRLALPVARRFYQFATHHDNTFDFTFFAEDALHVGDAF